MIQRTLVPVDVRPLNGDELRKPPRRFTTYMDERKVVPQELPDAPPLDGKTSIPEYLPLGVLVDRTLVPRGLPVKPLEKLVQAPTLPLDILASRVVVPPDVKPFTEDDLRPMAHSAEKIAQLREVVDPDIFITGNANLLIESGAKRDPRWDLMTRILSIVAHVCLIIFLVSLPKIFPSHAPTQADLALAKRQLQWIYIPPPQPKTPPAPTPQIRISPRTLKRLAPPVEEQPGPAPKPELQPKEPESAQAPAAPSAPKHQSSIAQSAPPAPTPSRLQAIRPLTRKRPDGLNLGLSQLSPGAQIQNQLRDAIRNGHSQGELYSPPPGPGRGGPGMGEGYQILSNTQGVDFTSYIQRLLATLKRNWYAVMPESAMLGDKGIVATTFRIDPDGSVPPPDPTLERSSGKIPLDNAAMSAIHASNPFEPLPSAFHGPYLRLRIYFIYNIPPDQIHTQ